MEAALGAALSVFDGRKLSLLYFFTPVCYNKLGKEMI